MIKKLDSKMDCVEITVLGKRTECLGFDSAKEIGKKLNELVDAVNKLETMAKNTNTVLESLVQENNIHEKQIDELQMKLEPEKCETPADPYAEQRKWIGKLCRFWDEKEEEKVFGILTTIDSDCGLSDMCPYWNDTTKNWFKHCEPVKDDIIYKGSDNE